MAINLRSNIFSKLVFGYGAKVECCWKLKEIALGYLNFYHKIGGKVSGALREVWPGTGGTPSSEAEARRGHEGLRERLLQMWHEVTGEKGRWPRFLDEVRGKLIC